MSIEAAPFSSRFLMIPLEMPSYLSTAYSIRFKEENVKTGLVDRICQIASQILLFIPRLATLIWELIHMEGSEYKDFERNIVRLEKDFKELDDKISSSDKPISVYFVGKNDHSGAILGNSVYYYHHHKIQQFEKYYAVAGAVIGSVDEMADKLNELKTKYPKREIKVIDIVAHGNEEAISLSSYRSSTIKQFKKNTFEDCAKDATIILDACSVGSGKNSLAEQIAEYFPGKTVFAPGSSLFFSKPVFKEDKEDGPKVDHVVHGFALVDAYTSRKFFVPDNKDV